MGPASRSLQREGGAVGVPTIGRVAALAWPVSVIAIEDSDLEPIGCPKCHSELETHQPDAARPHRLLGTCPTCGEWYLLVQPLPLVA